MFIDERILLLLISHLRKTNYFDTTPLFLHERQLSVCCISLHIFCRAALFSVAIGYSRACSSVCVGLESRLTIVRQAVVGRRAIPTRLRFLIIFSRYSQANNPLPEATTSSRVVTVWIVFSRPLPIHSSSRRL